jgi:rhodanese-related sulfurtransferase
VRNVAVILTFIILLVDSAHNARADVTTIQGEIIKISRRAEIVLIATNSGIEPVDYDESTRFINVKDDSSLKTGIPLKIRADDSNLIYYAREIEAPPPLALNNGRKITLKEFLDVLDNGSKVYDMRPEIDYLYGHIPGALPATGSDKEKEMIIFYCRRADCAESGIARNIASDNTVKKLFFAGGIDSWDKAQKPLSTTLKYLNKMRNEKVPFILIDIRDREVSAKGFIPDAVSIPYDVIRYTSYRFPAHKNAIIIVYGQNAYDHRSMKAAQLISQWGYTNVLCLNKGFEGYRQSGKDIAKGEMKEEIDYIVKLKAREISVELFKEYVESLPEDVIVLDVRDDEEFKQGHFRNSVNIPLVELQYRTDEIDTSKTILTHCASGARATIAYYILKKAGFNASCLNAHVGFDDSGLYSISGN